MDEDFDRKGTARQTRIRLGTRSKRATPGNPALLRVRELETLSRLSANPAARIYIGFDKHLPSPSGAG